MDERPERSDQTEGWNRAALGPAIGVALGAGIGAVVGVLIDSIALGVAGT